MRKKYLSALLFGALLFASAGTFTSCKDYDDDINNLQEQINTINTTLSELKTLVGNGGVSSVTFDEATGVLTVVDANGTKTYNVKTSAGEVGEIKVTIDGQNLIVNGETVGKIGDTVTVNEDGYLCVNGTATEIKAGKYTILKDSANGIYTITLPDEKGELQTIQLAMATANITISSYWYTFSRIDEIIKIDANSYRWEQISSDKDGLRWGVASKDIAWKGPKGTIKSGQLLVGQTNTPNVTVRPLSYDLSLQKIELVDSKGGIAPIKITATPASYDDNYIIGSSRTADPKGEWALNYQLTDGVTASNIATEFATEQYGNVYNKAYALSINGNIVTDYDYVIDTDENKTTTVNATTVKENSDIKLNGTYCESGSTSVISYADQYVYDIYTEFADADVNDAEAAGVTIKDNVISAPATTGQKSFDIKVHLLCVDGSEIVLDKTISIGSTQADAEEIAPTTYTVKANDKSSLVVNLGTTFSGLSADEAVSLTGLNWSTEDTKFLLTAGELNDAVTYYEDAECKTQVLFNDNYANIKRIKYAKFNIANFNVDATAGKHSITVTLYNVKGEYKKVNVPVEVVLPNFNDLFVKSAAWTDDNNVTMRLNVDGNATMMTAYKTSVDLSKQELTVNFGKLNTESAVQNDKASFNANDATFKITENVIKDHALQSVKAQSVYVLNGIKGFTIKSDEYTMKFISPLDGAKIVNYANNAETPFKIVGSEGTFNAYATPENKKNGVSLYINAKDHTLTGTNINTLTPVDVQWSGSFDAKAGNNAEAKVENGKLVITGLAALTYDTQLTMTYKGTVKVGNSEVWTSIPVTVSVVNE